MEINLHFYWLGIAGSAILLLVGAFLTAAESAFFHLPKPDREALEERKDRRATRILRLLSHPRRLTMAVRLTNLGIRFLLVALVTALALVYAPALSIHRALLVAIHLAATFILVSSFAEVIPRAYGISKALPTVLKTAPAMSALDRAMGPAVNLLVRILRKIAAALRLRWAIPYLTAEDVIAVVEAGEEEGEIEEEEREMIHSIFELGDTAVREIMVPRVDMAAVERKSPIRVALDKITERGHSRLPVYEERIDKIVGVVYAKDLLRKPARDDYEQPVEKVMRRPFFVPEGKRVDDLLREFQQEQIHLAIVVDEYGGTAGLVSIEDVLEEIVGEIQDEYDAEEELFETTGPDSAIVNAKIPIDDLNERFRINVPTDRHETLGGYLYDVIDRVPVEGESFEDPESGLLFKVEKVDRQRIARVRIRKALPTEESGEGEETSGRE